MKLLIKAKAGRWQIFGYTLADLASDFLSAGGEALLIKDNPRFQGSNINKQLIIVDDDSLFARITTDAKAADLFYTAIQESRVRSYGSDKLQQTKSYGYALNRQMGLAASGATLSGLQQTALSVDVELKKAGATASSIFDSITGNAKKALIIVAVAVFALGALYVYIKAKK